MKLRAFHGVVIPESSPYKTLSAHRVGTPAEPIIRVYASGMERRTPQRVAIEEALREAGRPLTPQELLDASRARVKSINLATIYRTLKLLTDAGSAVSVHIPGEPPRFEAAHIGHHHHFRCDVCRRVFDIAGCAGNLASLAPPGFRVREHDITLFGTCNECGKRKA